MPTEKDVIDKYNSKLVDILATDLTTSFSKFIENSFVSRDVCADIRGMYGVGEREKAARLLDKAVLNLKTMTDKQAWFFDFSFVVWTMSKDLGNEMRLIYQSGNDCCTFFSINNVIV